YDDKTPSPVAIPFDNYKGLNYQSWLYVTIPSTQVGSISASSPSNVIVSSPLGTPSITPQGGFSAFSPESFTFGCAQRAEQGLVGLARSCTVTVQGYDTKGNKVAEADFTFTAPSDLLKPAQQKAVKFPAAFSKLLGKVTFRYEGQLITTLVADSFKYKLYD
ncbi:MAG: hypothetical protein Q9198_006007, partial [Flavoplaca austrocitrina]